MKTMFKYESNNIFFVTCINILLVKSMIKIWDKIQSGPINQTEVVACCTSSNINFFSLILSKFFCSMQHVASVFAAFSFANNTKKPILAFNFRSMQRHPTELLYMWCSWTKIKESLQEFHERMYPNKGGRVEIHGG